MKRMRRALRALWPRRRPSPARYGFEVLYAGWVELPLADRALAAARARNRFPTRSKPT